MHQPQSPHPHNPQPNENQQIFPEQNDSPSGGLQSNHQQPLLEKNQKHFQIKFYEGYSSFNAELMIKNHSDRQKFEGAPETKTNIISAVISKQVHSQKRKMQVEDSRVINVEQPFKTEVQNERMVAESGACKVEESGFKNRVCQSYSMNRIYASINLQSREAMKRKLTRGMYSIASRKYQPIIDSREIFDDQDLNNNVIGPDECRLWRNLMNKYFLRTSKTDKIKTKTIIKSQIKLISDENEGRQEKKKQRKPRTKKRQDVLIKKEEQDLSEMIREQQPKLKGQFKKAQLNELKKEEDFEEKGIPNPKKSQPKHIEIEQ